MVLRVRTANFAPSVGLERQRVGGWSAVLADEFVELNRHLVEIFR